MALVIIMMSATARLWGVNIASPWTLLLGRRDGASECTCPYFYLPQFYLPRILETNSCRKRSASTSTHTFAFASSELASGLYIHMHRRRFHEGCVDGDPDRERIIHRRAAGTELRRQIDQVVSHLVDEIIHWPVSLPQLFEVLRRKQRLVAHIEANHGQPPAGLENYLRGFGVVVNIRFGGGVHIAATDRAAHDDDLFHQRNDGWILLNGERDVGERADWDERDFVRSGVHHLDDHVGAVAGIDFAFAGRQFDIGQT